jgi:hypothetical protein
LSLTLQLKVPCDERNTLCDHAAVNYRIFIGMGAELLMTGGLLENMPVALPPARYSEWSPADLS